MKKILVLMILGLTSLISFGAEKSMNDLKWFKTFECQKLQIKEYKSISDKSISKEVSIVDPEYIKFFMLLINRLPTSGEEMIKFGPDAGHLTLEFLCGGETQTLSFYNSKIKTPATSFFKNANSQETEVWLEIQNHFGKPTIGKVFPEVKNAVYQFDEFSIEYLGSEDRTPKGTTASRYVQTFKVVGKKDRNPQMVEVSSGQLPAKPQKFKVDDQNYVIHTYSDKSGNRLNPRMQIIYKD